MHDDDREVNLYGGAACLRIGISMCAHDISISMIVARDLIVETCYAGLTAQSMYLTVQVTASRIP